MKIREEEDLEQEAKVPFNETLMCHIDSGDMRKLLNSVDTSLASPQFHEKSLLILLKDTIFQDRQSVNYFMRMLGIKQKKTYIQEKAGGSCIKYKCQHCSNFNIKFTLKKTPITGFSIFYSIVTIIIIIIRVL